MDPGGRKEIQRREGRGGEGRRKGRKGRGGEGKREERAEGGGREEGEGGRGREEEREGGGGRLTKGTDGSSSVSYILASSIVNITKTMFTCDRHHYTQ